MTIIDKILKLEEFVQGEIADRSNIDDHPDRIRPLETILVKLQSDIRPDVVDIHRSVQHLLADSEKKNQLLLEFEHVVEHLSTANRLLRTKLREMQPPAGNHQ